MGLYEGTVEDLTEEKPARRRQQEFLTQVFKQMLRALMYIASVGILHRDVKPANILYTDENSATPESANNSVVNENFRFVLADFGLSKEQVQARTLQRGYPLFIAPEMRIPGAQQTYKVDVCSLVAGRPVVTEGRITKPNNFRHQQGKVVRGWPPVIKGRIAKLNQPDSILEKANFREQSETSRMFEAITGHQKEAICFRLSKDIAKKASFGTRDVTGGPHRETACLSSFCAGNMKGYLSMGVFAIE
jgi:serine/threonine protein kinase